MPNPTEYHKATDAGVIAELARAAAMPLLVHKNPDGSTYLVAGKIVEVEAPPDADDIALPSWLDAVPFALSDWCETPTVFVSPEEVVVVRSHRDRRGAARAKLRPTADYKFLLTLVNGKELEPRDLVFWLSRGLSRRNEPLERLIALLRKVTFTSTDTKSSTTTRTEDSMGRALHAQVDATADLPEFVPIPVAALCDCNDVGQVRLQVIPRPAAGTIWVGVYEEDLEFARTRALRVIAQTIEGNLKANAGETDDPIPVLMGGNI